MLNQKDIYISKCIDLNHEGLGVFKIDDFVCFVPNTIIGEEVKLEITKVNNNYAYGKVVEFITKSNHRVKPICKIYDFWNCCVLVCY